MRALLVHKVPGLQRMRETDAAALGHLRDVEPRAVEQMEQAAARQIASVALASETLAGAGFALQVVSRDAFDAVPEGTDLVVVAGGDGTVLDVSHRVIGVPLLAVNSDPVNSTGYFCACDATGLGEVLSRWRAGREPVFRLHRLALRINGELLPHPCLNDLLVANENPAMMSRYVLTAGDRSEEHASSGIWVSTPAGSTGAIRSAGGAVMPLDEPLIQYLVREPYSRRNQRFELARGIRHMREGLQIRSLMQRGRVFLDGPWRIAELHPGDTLQVAEGPPLSVVGLRPQQRER